MEKSNSFVVYNASAGSGKTFTLVKIYLSLLFSAQRNDAYRNILAITFTNKAVEEMKTRIVQNLIAFSQTEIPKDHRDLLEAIQGATGLGEEEIKKKSKRILKSMVHNYAAFEVSTIDAFTNRVIRTFAKDLGLSSSFEVELDVESVLVEAVDRVIARVGEDPQLTKTMVEFALSKADDDKSWDISRDLTTIAKLLPNENNFSPLEKLQDKNLEDFHAFSEKLKKEIAHLEKESVATAKFFFVMLSKNGLDNQDFSRGSIPGYFLKLQKKDFEVKFGSQWQANVAEEKLYPARISSEKKVCIDGLQPEIAELFRKSKETVLQRKFYMEIGKNLTQLSLLNVIRQEVTAIKKERNLLLISDFNKEISAHVKNQPVPFIYERLGERYRDYFIDEFQDTSQLQWENLIPLIDNTLSSQDENEKQGTLTVVGDAKQAIYRWRGGKAEQFMELCAGKSPFSTIPKLKILQENYRSKKEIVQFNNTFFAHVAPYFGSETHKELFENASQIGKKESGGYVNISFVEAKNKAEKEVAYPQKTLEIIRKLETNGYAKKDICILVRKRDQGIAVANFLNENEIPIISSETLLISRSPQVRFVSNLLAYSMNEEDKTLKMELLYFLWDFFPLKPEQHLFISEGLEFCGSQFFDYLEKLGLHFDLKKFQVLPLYDAVEYILRSFKLADKANAYLQFFLDFVFDYTQNNKGGISGFLEHWEEKKEKLSIVTPEGEDAVRIMTIHKSKGLEFPIVIYPFADENIHDTGKDNLWISLETPMNDISVAYISASNALLEYGKNAYSEYQHLLLQKELDAMNLLYVTCTRPKQQLYIISEWVSVQKIDKRNKFSHFFIDYLNNLGRWDDAIFSYEFGEFMPCEIPAGLEQEEMESIGAKEAFISTSPSSHNLNIVTKSGSLWGTFQEKAIARGEVLHEIMSFIQTRSDLETALKRSVGGGIITENEVNPHRKMLLKIIDHPDLKRYYELGTLSFNEKEILDAGEILRPDRINVHEGRASIIDYKTGNFLPKHKTQIHRYGQAVSNLGYAVDQKFLVYINEDIEILTA